MLELRSPRRALPTPRPRPPMARPRLEPLADRWIPASMEFTTGPFAAPPALLLHARYGMGRTVTLSGDLVGVDDVSDITINISGKATGSTTTDVHGHYTITLQATALGIVTATTGDEQLSAQVTLTDEAPVITAFEACE